MLPDRSTGLIRSHWIEIAWGSFAVLNLAAMLLVGDWATVPFHLLWVSFTLVCGFRVWSVRSTVWTLAVVMVMTGTFILIDVFRVLQPIDELTEVPLMAAMFVAMVWHARRRQSAMEALQRVSEDNLALLERAPRFIQDASHELRTPITVALGHTELIQRNSRHELVAQDAAVVADELHRLRRLAERLLVLAAAEHPGFLVKTTIDLEPLLVETLRRWSPTPRRWGLGDVDEATVEGDRDRLQLALDALIENAVKHTSPEDSIELGLSRRGDTAVLTVADSGGGIPAETLEREVADEVDLLVRHGVTEDEGVDVLGPFHCLQEGREAIGDACGGGCLGPSEVAQTGDMTLWFDHEIPAEGRRALARAAAAENLVRILHNRLAVQGSGEVAHR